jgi:hypothetical protein
MAAKNRLKPSKRRIPKPRDSSESFPLARTSGILSPAEYRFSVGSAGDPPTGTRRKMECKNRVSARMVHLSVPGPSEDEKVEVAAIP